MKLKGKGLNTGAIGAVVTARAGGAAQKRLVQSGSSYISQEDKRLHFGLGKAAAVDVAGGPLAGRDHDDAGRRQGESDPRGTAAVTAGTLVPRPRSPVNTEGGDAPRAQGARRAHTGSMQPTSNAAPGDAAPAECKRISGTRVLAGGSPRRWRRRARASSRAMNRLPSERACRRRGSDWRSDVRAMEPQVSRKRSSPHRPSNAAVSARHRSEKPSPVSHREARASSRGRRSAEIGRMRATGEDEPNASVTAAAATDWAVARIAPASYAAPCLRQISCCSIPTICAHHRRIVRSPSGPHPVGHSAKRNARLIALSPGFRRSAAHWMRRSAGSMGCSFSMRRKFVRAPTEPLRCASGSVQGACTIPRRPPADEGDNPACCGGS